MGNQQSQETDKNIQQDLIPSLQVHTLCREHKLSFAQLFYCHRRFIQLKPQKQPVAPSKQSKKWFRQDSKVDPRDSPELVSPDSFDEMLKSDWILSRVWYQVFPSNSPETLDFPTFVRAISWWRGLNTQSKLSCRLPI